MNLIYNLNPLIFESELFQFVIITNQHGLLIIQKGLITKQLNLKWTQILQDILETGCLKARCRIFKYGNTTMTAFAENNNIRKTKVGNRVFYNYEDIVALLDGNIE